MPAGAANAVTPPSQTPGVAAPAAAPDKAGTTPGAKPAAGVGGKPPANVGAAGEAAAGAGAGSPVPGKPVLPASGGKAGNGGDAAPAAGVEKEAPKDEKVASRFAALTRREEETRKGEEKLQGERKAWETEKKSLEQRYAGFDKLAQTAKADPIEAFRLVAGLADKAAAVKVLVRHATGKKETDAERIDRLEREKQDEKQAATEVEKKRAHEQAQRDAEAAEVRTKDDITKLVLGDVEKFELLSKEEEAGKGRAGQLVWAVMDRHYRATFNPETRRGEVLPIDQAVQMCEDGLTERVRRLKDSKKFQAKPDAPAPAPAAEPPGKAAPKAPAAGQHPPTPEPEPGKKLTRAQEVELAAANARKRKEERDRQKANATS